MIHRALLLHLVRDQAILLIEKKDAELFLASVSNCGIPHSMSQQMCLYPLYMPRFVNNCVPDRTTRYHHRDMICVDRVLTEEQTSVDPAGAVLTQQTE